MLKERFFGRGGFPRSSRHRGHFQKGNLKYIILDLIKDKPRHGYEIILELEEQSHGFYKPSPGVIYPTLQMLEEMGYAKSTEQDSKKVYSITDEGLKFMIEQKDIASDIKSRIKHRWSFKNIGKMVSVMKEYHALESLLGRGLRHLDTDKANRIGDILTQAYRDIESIIQE
jgi:DNA-binding PadR family transcriptional regulator